MMQTLVLPCLLANIFWFFIFSPLTAHMINFWIGMSLASGSLALIGIVTIRKNITKGLTFKPVNIIVGVMTATMLYGLFWVGHAVSTSLFPFAQNQIVMIYATKNQLAPQIIAVLLVFLIGPAEEIFWRGFVQQRLSTIYDQQKGYIFATCLYAMVHIYAMNFMLFMAALICGAFWGYWYKKTGSLWVVMISHALWDVTIFILFPIK